MIIELAGREVLPSSTFQSLSIDRDFCLNLDSDLLGLFLKSEDKTAASEWSVKTSNVCHRNVLPKVLRKGKSFQSIPSVEIFEMLLKMMKAL